MTPEREKYLAKCSKREKYLRKEIRDYKNEIRTIKSALQTESDYEWYLGCLKFRKLWLTMVRHELHRLKGMDRVVVPKRAEGYIGVFVCSCGSDVIANYCPNCGRKLLWEKVK